MVVQRKLTTLVHVSDQKDKHINIIRLFFLVVCLFVWKSVSPHRCRRPFVCCSVYFEIYCPLSKNYERIKQEQEWVGRLLGYSHNNDNLWYFPVLIVLLIRLLFLFHVNPCGLCDAGNLKTSFSCVFFVPFVSSCCVVVCVYFLNR